MLTPSKYWRLPCPPNGDVPKPSDNFVLPEEFASKKGTPTKGHGITIATYDAEQETGYLHWLGIVTGGMGNIRTVQWQPTNARIDVDSKKGASYWEAGAFAFAPKKPTDYGLHELWAEQFDLELRDQTPNITRPRAPRASRSQIAPERLNPMEVIGEPTTGQRAGVVYVLRSAYGYKVGRTNNVPARMRAFGVHLPIVYTIPLCAWFEDCHEAEKRYHRLFQDKHINGEWFDLTDQDIQQIRGRI
jgi:hypothetical protein